MLSERIRNIVLVIGSVIMAIALWSLFYPGDMAEGSPGAALGEWSADPEGGEAAVKSLGLKVEESKDLVAVIVTKSRESQNDDLRISIMKDKVTISGKSRGIQSFVTILEGRPAHYVQACAPATRIEGGAAPISFKQTARGLLWEGIALRKSNER